MSEREEIVGRISRLQERVTRDEMTLGDLERQRGQAGRSGGCGYLLVLGGGMALFLLGEMGLVVGGLLVGVGVVAIVGATQRDTRARRRITELREEIVRGRGELSELRAR